MVHGTCMLQQVLHRCWYIDTSHTIAILKFMFGYLSTRYSEVFYKNISRTSAVSSTNFGSILIFLD